MVTIELFGFNPGIAYAKWIRVMVDRYVLSWEKQLS